MINYEELLAIPPYSLDKVAKSELLTDILCVLTRHHYQSCIGYRKLLNAMKVKPVGISDYRDIPFLPVKLFKEYDLKSVEQGDVVKTMTSSGTTGQQVSKIYLDRETSALQTKTLTKIVNSYIGKSRLPMIIIDSSAVVENRVMFSARGAGILGFSLFGRDKVYALNENMEFDIKALETFLEKHKDEKIFLFGFTFMIWQHFYKLLKAISYRPDLSKGILIHGGGWKKLADKAVSPKDFKTAIKEVCGIEKIYDYYGMVEQTGTIYMECEYGHLHTSVFSDVIVRRHTDFSEAEIGEKGIIQVVSVLPKSYPGHSLLTEDEGVILGEDDCACGRKGKYFSVFGRVKNAEIRGCSDAYATKFT